MKALLIPAGVDRQYMSCVVWSVWVERGIPRLKYLVATLVVIEAH